MMGRRLPPFEDSYMPEPNTGCWLWTGATRYDGYGTRPWRGKTSAQAHRIAWEVFRGPIPDGLQVLHRCDVRCCVNPDHLFLGTQLDNMRDMIQKGRKGRNPF